MSGHFFIEGLLLLALIGAVFFFYRKGLYACRMEQSADRERLRAEKAEAEKRARELAADVMKLNDLNERYLNFMFQVPTIVTRLNTMLRFEDVANAIVNLTKDMLDAQFADLYMLDRGTDTLVRARSTAIASQGKALGFKIGEGLVGKCAEHRTARVRAHGEGALPEEADLWMAAPVGFQDRLVGVIAVGRVKKPTGNERSLIKMIADIAGVALVNQAFLGEAREDAITDPLTGLHNRRFFERRAAECVEEALRKGTPMSVFLFDIDNFKHYNDTNGHGEGDTLLKEISGILKETTRATTVVARYGGEEFIALLNEVPKDGAVIYANRLREKIASHPFAHREKQPLGTVSISGGVAAFPEDGGSIREVIRLADAALYRAKRAGRNLVMKHEPVLFSDPGQAETGPPQG